MANTNSYDNNKLYRILNLPTDFLFQTEGDTRIVNCFTDIFGDNAVTVKGTNQSEGYLEKLQVDFGDQNFFIQKVDNNVYNAWKIGFNGIPISTSDTDFITRNGNTDNNYNCLFIKTGNDKSAALSYCVAATNDDPNPCISTLQPYIIFTKVKHLNNPNTKYPCIILEKSYINASNNYATNIYIKIFNSDDPNTTAYKTLSVTNDVLSYQVPYNNSSKYNNIQTFPVISQMALKFDDYVFPYLYKKSSNFEGDFGLVIINKQKYYFTRYFAIPLIEEGGR